MTKVVKQTEEVARTRALKELARLCLVAAAVVVVQALQAGGKINWATVATGAVVAAYRAASTYVHDNPNIPLPGLFWF